MKFVLGIILSTILLMSGLGYDVNYAEADHADQSEADAINDLALQSISKYNNKSDRNNITLTWSAPNNNGGAISQYILQVHETSGSGWTTLDNNIQGTTYTHSNAATGYQFSYRVFALSPDGCHGSGNYLDGCNQGNILDVVSLPNAERGAPTPQCENKKLDDCGYFPDDTSTTDETPTPTKLETPAPTPAPTTPAPITPAPKEQPPSGDPYGPSIVIFSGMIAAIIIYSSLRHTRKAKRNRPAWNRTKERQEISGYVRHQVYDRDEYHCRGCGKSAKDYDLEIDHIKPVSKGGTNHIRNLQTLCEDCNKEKGNKWKGKGHSYRD